jgi:hypothetical protein
MQRHESQDLLLSLQLLTHAAERFVNHAPQSKRLEQDQRALLAAITKAQLMLSVHRLPSPEDKSAPRNSATSRPKVDQKKSPRSLMRLV